MTDDRTKLPFIERQGEEPKTQSDGFDSRDAKFWLEKLEASHRRDEQWINKATKYMRRFKNESYQKTSSDAFNSRYNSYNIFYANTELLKSALLSEIPKQKIKCVNK